MLRKIDLRWTDGRKDGWTEEWTERRTDRHTDHYKAPAGQGLNN